MDINFNFKKETDSCYRFESGERPDLMTLYLKKNIVEEAGINPLNGITVTVQERQE
jgi:hypothetical protein